MWQIPSKSIGIKSMAFDRIWYKMSVKFFLNINFNSRHGRKSENFENRFQFVNVFMLYLKLSCQRHKQRAENNPRPRMGLQHMINPAPRGDTLPADLEMMASYTDKSVAVLHKRFMQG